MRTGRPRGSDLALGDDNFRAESARFGASRRSAADNPKAGPREAGWRLQPDAYGPVPAQLITLVLGQALPPRRARQLPQHALDDAAMSGDEPEAQNEPGHSPEYERGQRRAERENEVTRHSGCTRVAALPGQLARPADCSAALSKAR
jgi:hypothetical protein